MKRKKWRKSRWSKSSLMMVKTDHRSGWQKTQNSIWECERERERNVMKWRISCVRVHHQVSFWMLELYHLHGNNNNQAGGTLSNTTNYFDDLYNISCPKNIIIFFYNLFFIIMFTLWESPCDCKLIPRSRSMMTKKCINLFLVNFPKK